VLAEKSQANASDDAKVALAKRQANVGVALVVLGQGEKVWPVLTRRPDTTPRSILIDRLAPGGTDPKVLMARFRQEQDVSIKAAILLTLGEFGLDRVPLMERQITLPSLLQVYRDDPDPGIHGAAEWLLQRWGQRDKLKEIEEELETRKAKGKWRWYINPQGQTMVIVLSHWNTTYAPYPIASKFAIASKEVTLEQFSKFKRIIYNEKYAPRTDCPAFVISWYDAAAYCNWLSQQEGVTKEEWCYHPNEKGQYAEGMTIAPDYLMRAGYRLPTTAEWSHACLAGTYSGYWGYAEELADKYAWSISNSSGRVHPVGMLKPNSWGLFDMFGNDFEWCHDNGPFGDLKPGDGRDLVIDKRQRCLAGGGMETRAMNFSAGSFQSVPPSSHILSRMCSGLRPARTIR
jgi:hypothetical protein